MNLNPIFALLSGLFAILVCLRAGADVRDNNHIFEVAELGNIKVELLAQTSGIALGKFEVPEFENKQPQDLYQSTLEAYQLLRKLQRLVDVEVQPEAESLLVAARYDDTYDLLEIINQGLDVLLLRQDLERPLGPESLYGKSADDNYSRLWYLNTLLTELLSPPDSRSVQTQLAYIKKSLSSIAEHKSLTNAKPVVEVFQQKNHRDGILVAYQNLHLLGRLQRQLSVEPVRPESPISSEKNLIDIFEVTRSTIGHLYRTRNSLSLPDPGSVSAATEDSSANDIYLSLREIHDQLVAMTGSQPL